MIDVVVDVSVNAPNNDTTTNAEAGNGGTPAPSFTCTTTPKDLCNVVSVSSITSDPDLTDNAYAQPTNVIPFVADGLLEIRKVVVGAPNDYAGGDFTVTYACTKDGSDPLGGTPTIAYPLPANFTTSIPEGYECSVTAETAKASPASNYDWTGEDLGDPVTITEAGPNVITVTNTMSRDQGSVQLVKSWGTGTVGETILKIGTGTTDATDDDVATEDLTGTTRSRFDRRRARGHRHLLLLGGLAGSQLHNDLRLRGDRRGPDLGRRLGLRLQPGRCQG